jgi:hypothetical protein
MCALPLGGGYDSPGRTQEAHSDIYRQLRQIESSLERIEERCAERLVCACQQKQD